MANIEVQVDNFRLKIRFLGMVRPHTQTTTAIVAK